MDYRLITGDANKVIPRLAGEGVQVDMIFCSPNPLFYNIREGGHDIMGAQSVGSEHTLTDYLDHLCIILSKARALLKDAGSLWVHMMDIYMLNGSMLQVPERFAFRMTQHYEWLLRGKRVWLRGPHEITPGSSAAERLCPWDWEPVYWFTQNQEEYTFNADSPYAKTSVIQGAPYVDNRLPQRVAAEAIDLTTKPGDTVLDCFVGGGQVGLAALGMGRKFIGIDLFPEKVALAQKRLRSVVS